MTETLFAFATVNPAASDALVRMNRAVTHGFEQLAKHYFDSVRQSFEDGVRLQRRYAGTTSVADLAALQGQLAQEAWQSAWDRGREWSDLGSAIAREVVTSVKAEDTVVKAQKKAA